MVGKDFNELTPEESGNFDFVSDDLMPVLDATSMYLADTGELIPASPTSAPKKSLTWWLMGLTSCGVLGGIAGFAFWWLLSLPPVPNCQQISSLSPDIERLYCAQVAAESGELPELLAGLDMLEEWTPQHPLYQESQRWLDDWSDSVLTIARQRMANNNLEGAIALASRIPESSPQYDNAQVAIAQWKSEWQEGEVIYGNAQVALKQQQWEVVSEHLLTLSQVHSDHWRLQQTRILSQQLLTEKRARQTLAQAQALAESNDPAQLKEAVRLVSEINPQTYTWADAQLNLKQWGETLLGYGFQEWYRKNLDETIGTAELVAAIPSLRTEAHQLKLLGEARKLAISTVSTWEVSPADVFNMMEAIAAARKIPSNSRFYAQAQDSLASWETQLRDLTQLQAAQVAAALGQPDALKTAIAQAHQVQPDHPRRLQAQTLIAHWNHEMERLEDAPTVRIARQLAEPGTVPALRLAIAQASKVEMGRVLRGEAQGLIYDWNRQIQTLEDRPFLDLARTLARQGRLSDAIESAAVIAPERALYSQAQSAIQDWRAEIHRSEIARRQRQQQEAAMTTIVEQAVTISEANPLSFSETISPLDDESYSQPEKPPVVADEWNAIDDAPIEDEPVEQNWQPEPSYGYDEVSPMPAPPVPVVSEPPALSPAIEEAPPQIIDTPAPSLDLQPAIEEVPPQVIEELAPAELPPAIEEAPIPISSLSLE